MRKSIFKARLSLAGVSVFLLLFSCNKINKNQVEKEEVSSEWKKQFVSNEKEEEQRFNLFKSECSEFDMSHFDDVAKNINDARTKVSVVWGIGSNNTVWKWNGSSWFQPNSAARLKFVNPSSSGGAVWGIGTNLTVWKWNGASWYQPNSNATLYYICSFDANVAIGMGYGGVLFITTNGGASWSYFTNINNVVSMSVGNFVTNTIWVTQYYNGSYRLLRYDYSSSSWIVVSTPVTPRHVSAMYAEGAYFLQNGGYNIYKKLSNTSGSFYQPNSNAGLLQVSPYGDDLHAWGIGPDDRIYHTNNGGAGWDEPNPAARLKNICAGYE